ncbi:hypothetical protein I302_103594 [Kwoniella bestiolae CBS 10118]|uniref:Uncharacterized protein n=1 Tax=Kwoniella bestiolae CBS 10118 TaxID=1296100 RepID=A0A1B9G8X4_9TREE|nr:hypothetical protein I302_02295 [Kwoniella bestiolae CBS 10118]OCF27453.1 hypothetical protein I302_02295 [Kwoniella bestiolae CBS 10118]
MALSNDENIKFNVNFDIEAFSYGNLPLFIRPSLGLTRFAHSQEEYDKISAHLPEVQSIVKELCDSWSQSEETQRLVNDRARWEWAEATEWGSMVLLDKMGLSLAAQTLISETLGPNLTKRIGEITGGMGCNFTFIHCKEARRDRSTSSWVQSVKGCGGDPHLAAKKPYEYLEGEDGGDWTRL